MSLSKLINDEISPDKVVIGKYRADIQADRAAEKRLMSTFLGINVHTTIEGKKLVPVQDILKVEQQLIKEKKESEQTGYDNGYNDGLEKGHKEAQQVIDNFASLIKGINNQRNNLLEEAHQKILELILKIASKVTFDAARIDPDITASVISGTIAKLVEKSKIKVKVNPDHLPMIEQQIERFKGESTAIKEISIEPDGRVAHGGCFIETPNGDIDARIESQMEILAKTLNVDGDSE